MTKIDENYNIVQTKGDTFKLIFSYVTSAGVAIDFTGWHMYFKAGAKGQPLIMDLDETDGIDLTTPGTIIITYSYTNMALIDAGVYSYSWKVIDENGIKTTWTNGACLSIREENPDE